MRTHARMHKNGKIIINSDIQLGAHSTRHAFLGNTHLLLEYTVRYRLLRQDTIVAW